MERIKVFIKDGSCFSLNQIKEMKDNGISVMRSAHSGNLDAPTLFLAAFGASIFLDEYARGSMRVYRPAFKVVNGIEDKLCDNEELPVSHLFKDGYNLSCYHYNSAKDLYPNSIKLTSSHILRYKDKLIEAYKILLRYRPQSFERVIMEDGTILKYHAVEDNKIYFLEDGIDTGGIAVSLDVLPEKIIKGLEYTQKLLNGEKDLKPEKIFTLDVDTDISLLTLCDIDWNAIKTNSIDAIHFSGLEMINYMVKDINSAKEHSMAFNEIFNLLIGLWCNKAPLELTIYVVPTDSISMLVRNNKDELRLLDDSLKAYIEINELNKIRKDKWRELQISVGKHVASLPDDEAISLVSKVDIENTPSSFINSLNNVLKDLRNNIVNRTDINRVLNNYILYKELEKTDIPGIDKNIEDKFNTMNLVKDINKISCTQYDLLNGTKIYFPDNARCLSMEELKIYLRRLKNE